MANLNVLQNIIPASCPHCDKLIFISYQFSMPMLSHVFTEFDIQEAKAEVRNRIKENADIPDTDKAKVEEWIASPKTLFGKEDVETVVQNIIQASHDTLTIPETK
jgi:hypothetical protein